MNDFDDFREEGPDWEGEEEKMEEEQPFEEKQSETSIRSERIRNVPGKDELYFEGGDRESFQTDGKRRRVIAYEHKELFVCDCGCTVDNVLKTRRDSSGGVYCEKHSMFFCLDCGQIIKTGEHAKVLDSYYHRIPCAVPAINSILSAVKGDPKSLSRQEVGKLLSLKDSINEELLLRNMQSLKRGLTRFFRRNKKEIKVRSNGFE